VDNELIKGLKIFNLSEYEAKAYTALVSVGTGSVTEISQLCDVPRSNLYAVLEKLSEKGFAEIQRGRPILFKAVDPSAILDEKENDLKERVKNAKRRIIDKMEKLKGTKEGDTVPALIWGVRGYDNVINKIGEIVKRSRNEILLNIPDLSILDDGVYEELKNAKERGVKIKIAAESRGDIEKYRKVSTLRIRDKIHGVDIVGDGREVFVAPSIPVVGAWIDNPEMALHVKDFLNLVWKDAMVLK
jgi:sugar-specific transcriptional regulator TrmB